MTARGLAKQTIFNETQAYSIHRIESLEHGTVIVKESRSNNPTRKEISQLENEYRMLKSVEGTAGVPKAIALEVESHKALLILEDFGGISLKEFAGQKPIPVGRFFTIAKKIVEILGRLHEQNIVHCDLKPNNIIVSPEELDVQIIDFGSSRHLVGRGQFQNDGQSLTLAYMAPEQTGRVNRRVDHRTDYYSLGITFYELLSGKLPFQAHDALEWVHAHIAKKARSLHDLDHHITPALSQIVDRLLSKAPEERYQTSEGLLYDLQLAEKLFDEKQLWDSIRVGERDRSTYFSPSQKIVGRDREIEFLKQSYARSGSKGLQFVSVQGEAGVGKSALVREFRRIYADQATLFAFGKADARQMSFPFGAFSSIADDLVRQIHLAPEQSKTLFVSEIVQRLQDGVGALLIIAPQLKEILGAIEPSADASDNESRLSHTVFVFFETLCDVFGQVVVVLDDAHFVDEASSRLANWLIQNAGALRLLFIFTYRQSEMNQPQNLSLLLQSREDVRLNDLNLKDVTLLLQDTLQDDSPKIGELGLLLLKKSGGNALFVSQVLKSWIDEQFLFHDPYQGWTWNSEAIEAQEISKSVLDLLETKINSLPKDVRYIFTMASCFPTLFTTNDLSELTGLDHAGIRRAADITVEAGLTISESESVYRFSHEQIREAFYSMLNEESRRELHSHVGFKLLRSIDPATASNEQIYTTAQHLNVGLSRVNDSEIRRLIAQLNQRAAKLARDSSAFELALSFANYGVDAGANLEWSETSSILYELYALKGECEYLSGKFEVAQITFEKLQQQSRNRTERIKTSLQWLKILQSTSKTVEALDYGLQSLENFGVKINRKPKSYSLMLALLRATWELRGEKVARIPVLGSESEEDDFKRMRHEMLVLTSELAYFVDKALFLRIGLTGYRLGLAEGLTGEIANHIILVGMVLATRFGGYKQVERNCVNTVDRLGDRIPLRSRLLTSLNRFAFIKPWVHPWVHSVPQLERLEELAIKAGEPFVASFAALYGAYYRIYQGLSVEETETTLGSLEYLKKHNPMLYECALPSHAFRAILRGETASELDFSHGDFNEGEFVARIESLPTQNPRAWYDAHKMMALFLFGHYDKAAEHFEGVRRYITLVPFSITVIFIRVFALMNVCEMQRAGVRISLSMRWSVRGSRRFIKACAKLNPDDVAPYAFLVDAEFSVLKGRQLEAMNFYERAAEAALKAKSWMAAGLVYERTARFNIHNGRERLARAHAQEAVYCFERWGASAKARQVRQLYGLVSSRISEGAGASSSSLSSSSSSSSTDSSRLSERVDAETIIKSTRALSSELDIDALSVKLTNVVMEFAGATRATLLLPTLSGGLAIKASVGATSELYPDLVNVVARSRTPVVVDQSLNDERTKSDPYFNGRKAMSALCVPIAQSNELLAVLYLENDSGSNVFTPERQDLLDLLLGQAGVALENARLYSEVVEKVRMSGELKTAQTVQRTLFPNPQLKLSNVAVTGYYEPASECGGDWWFYHEHGNKLFVYIGDATGHGASAALVTSAVRSAVSLLSDERELTPQVAMRRLNRAIFETSKGTMNMTFFIGAYDRKTGVFDYCNASHEPSYVVRKNLVETLRATDGSFQDFKSKLEMLSDVHGARLGEEPDSAYTQSMITLAEGDVVVLYTDGIQDARNDAHQEWGQRRFIKSIFQSLMRSQDVDEIVQQIVGDNKAYTGATPHDDDVMIVALRGR